MKHALLFLAALSLVACGSEKVSGPQSMDEVPSRHASEIQPNTHSNDHSHDAHGQGGRSSKIKAEPSEDFRPFNQNDRSTWGEVVATDQSGKPTAYARRLPNGNIQSLAFFHQWDNKMIDFHGWKNEEIKPEKNIPGAEYKHWNRPNRQIPIVFMDATTKPEWSVYLREAVKKWDTSEMFSLQMGRANTVKKKEELIKKCNSRMKGIVLACNYNFIYNDKAPDTDGGLAIIESTPDGHIHSGVIHFNDNFHRFDPAEVNAQTVKYNKEFMVCHEVGHALGLWHAGEDKKIALGTCMDYSNDPEPNLDPNEHDFAELELIYNHSHDDDVAMGYVCSRSGEEDYTSYVQRVEFNGIESIAQTVLKTNKISGKPATSRSVIITTRNDDQVHYSWHTANYSNMYPHRKGMTGEYPSLTNHKVDATNYARIFPVTFEMSETMMDAKVNTIKAFSEQYQNGTIKEQCKVLSGKDLGDVDHFFPPKNGTTTNSYAVDKKKVGADGKRYPLDDYELFYEYVADEDNFIDPDIRPISGSEHSGP